MAKRVWILGAGFSRPLGGPLLPDLMRPEVIANLDATYPAAPYQRDKGQHQVVLKTYGYGTNFQQGRPRGTEGLPGENIWSDAE
jgi:hypothetical protein